MVEDTRLSVAMNAEIKKIAEEIGSEEKMQIIADKYDLFKKGALAMWSIDEDEKQILIRLMETEIAFTESEKNRISEENRRMDKQFDDIVKRAETGDVWDGVERLTKEAFELEEKKEKKSFLKKIFGDKE